MTSKKLLSAALLFSTGVVMGMPHKELQGAHGAQGRDPFCWKQEKIKRQESNTVLQRKQSVKKTENKNDMPWRACGVSISEKGQCALFACNNETKVVLLHQEICRDWNVERITLSSVQLKHSTGECRELVL